MHRRRHHAISLQQASHEAPELTQLLRQTQEAQQRLRCIRPLIPENLRAAVQAGPIEDAQHWCLLVSSHAAAAKLRQLLPAFAAHLRTKGWQVEHIRLRVLGDQHRYSHH